MGAQVSTRCCLTTGAGIGSWELETRSCQCGRTILFDQNDSPFGVDLFSMQFVPVGNPALAQGWSRMNFSTIIVLPILLSPSRSMQGIHPLGGWFSRCAIRASASFPRAYATHLGANSFDAICSNEPSKYYAAPLQRQV
jgi:hypothetical protein